MLNCQQHDIPALVSSRLLRPLGNPPPNGIKFFATVEVVELLKDRAWLTKVTNTINQHWHRQNARKKSRFVNGSQNGDSSVLDVMGGGGGGVRAASQAVLGANSSVD